MTPEEAQRFAEKHVATWNGHNLEQILDMYTEDIELVSPLAVSVSGGSSICGKAALRDYFTRALAKYPNLQFQLLNTLLCVDSLTLYFLSVSSSPVAEVIFLGEDQRIRKVLAHYTC